PPSAAGFTSARGAMWPGCSRSRYSRVSSIITWKYHSWRSVPNGLHARGGGSSIVCRCGCHVNSDFVSAAANDAARWAVPRSRIQWVTRIGMQGENVGLSRELERRELCELQHGLVSQFLVTPRLELLTQEVLYVPKLSDDH